MSGESNKAKALLESILPLLNNPNVACQRIGVTCLSQFIRDPNHRQLLEQSGALETLNNLCQRKDLDPQLQMVLYAALSPLAEPEAGSMPYYQQKKSTQASIVMPIPSLA
jgi:hypothetical protein